MAQGQLGLYGPCPAEIRPAALRVKARVYDLGPDVPRPAEHQTRTTRGARRSGPPVDRGPGVVDPGERGALTDRTTADCGGV